jgi:hypothetical protein
MAQHPLYSFTKPGARRITHLHTPAHCQAYDRVRRIPIASVECANASLSAAASAFVVEPLRVLVTTAVPHGAPRPARRPQRL